MRVAKSPAAATFIGMAAICSIATVQAAPLPTNIAAMKAMITDETVQQARWGGGYRGGWGGYRGGLGYRGGGWGYRRWGGVAAGAIVGGAIARSAYYGGYPSYGYGGGYYGGGYYPAYSGYGYGGCDPSAGYSYPAYSYRRYYGW